MAAMSGGVDSSVSAALLKEAGYEVIGVTMQLWPKEECSPGRDRICCSLEGIRDARYVAQKLGISFYVVDFHKEFKKHVIDYFIRQYLEGFTPNPCILCNEKIKFGALLDKAKELEADFVATGHYAQTCRDEKTGRSLLKEGSDKSKDQSYALFGLTQEQLGRAIFPVGALDKTEVRSRAKDLGLEFVQDKKDSQEICFVEDDYAKYMTKKAKIKITAGRILDKDGNVLGRHKGTPFYTIGQRQGLGIAYKEPLYVTAIDVKKNELTVGTKKDVLKTSLVAGDLNWIAFDKPPKTFRAEAKIRYKHKKAAAQVSVMENNDVKVEFNEPQEAPTPGQAVVFYDGETVIGGGWISKVTA
ncbi:MAG: tRNA 2-thiouridine(34) synthase MnmA [Candidatus Omnitrophica bacterium]|nr:tRNA 2-thiouridine(34) synthase MnmA [Candidatus Omnitrophota bacterium]